MISLILSWMELLKHMKFFGKFIYLHCKFWISGKFLWGLDIALLYGYALGTITWCKIHFRQILVKIRPNLTDSAPCVSIFLNFYPPWRFYPYWYLNPVLPIISFWTLLLNTIWLGIGPTFFWSCDNSEKVLLIWFRSGRLWHMYKTICVQQTPRFYFENGILLERWEQKGAPIYLMLLILLRLFIVYVIENRLSSKLNLDYIVHKITICFVCELYLQFINMWSNRVASNLHPKLVGIIRKRIVGFVPVGSVDFMNLWGLNTA